MSMINPQNQIEELTDLKNKSLHQLAASRRAMLQLDYLLTLEGLPEDEQKNAAWQLHRLQLAYLQLRRARLSEIGERLRENQGALSKGIDLLEAELADLRSIRKIVAAVADLVKIIARIVG